MSGNTVSSILKNVPKTSYTSIPTSFNNIAYNIEDIKTVILSNYTCGTPIYEYGTCSFLEGSDKRIQFGKISGYTGFNNIIPLSNSIGACNIPINIYRECGSFRLRFRNSYLYSDGTSISLVSNSITNFIPNNATFYLESESVKIDQQSVNIYYLRHSSGKYISISGTSVILSATRNTPIKTYNITNNNFVESNDINNLGIVNNLMVYLGTSSTTLFSLPTTNTTSNVNGSGLIISTTNTIQFISELDSQQLVPFAEITSVDNYTTTSTSQIKKVLSSIDISGNGNILSKVIIDLNTNVATIKVSTNNGSSWSTNYTTNLTNINNVYPVMNVSWDGMYQSTLINGRILISQDYGTSWFNPEGGDINGVSNTTTKYWTDVCVSKSGKIQLGTRFNDYIYISQDFGVNWYILNKNITTNSNSTLKNWNKVSTSADGKYSVAVASNIIYISSDNGFTWTPTDQTNVVDTLNCCKVSNNGAIQVIGGNNGIYYSTNYGQTWLKRFSLTNVVDISLTSTGATQIFLTNSIPYISVDNGNSIVPLYLKVYPTTQPQTTITDYNDRFWFKVCSNFDGSKIFMNISSYVNSTTVLTYANTYSCVIAPTTYTLDINEINFLYNSPVIPSYTSDIVTSNLIANWSSITSTEDGSIRVACVNNGRIYIWNYYDSQISQRDIWSLLSIKSGGVDTVNNIDRPWKKVVVSKKSNILIAVEENGNVYLGNFDQTIKPFPIISWITLNSIISNTNPNNNWSDCCISNNGTTITLVAKDNYIYHFNIISGVWVVNTFFEVDSLNAPVSRNWISVDMSSDGTYQTALEQGGSLYIYNINSVTSVRNWIAISNTSKKQPNDYWCKVSLSSVGDTQLAISSKYAYISKNYGYTWNIINDNLLINTTTSVVSTTNFNSCNVGSDGNIMTITTDNSNCFISYDGGNNWSIYGTWTSPTIESPFFNNNNNMFQITSKVVYSITASVNDSDAYKILDGYDDTYWSSFNTNTNINYTSNGSATNGINNSVIVSLAYPIDISNIVLTPYISTIKLGNNTYIINGPKDFTIYGSNDTIVSLSTNWNKIIDITGTTYTNSTPTLFDINSRIVYKNYKIDLLSIPAYTSTLYNGGFVGISGLTLYGRTLINTESLNKTNVNTIITSKNNWTSTTSFNKGLGQILSTSSSNGQILNDNMSTSKGRYIRITYGNNNSKVIQLIRIKVYDKNYTILNYTLTSNTDNTVTVQTLTSSPNIISLDTNTQTFTFSNSTNVPYIDLDLGSDYNVGKIELYVPSTNRTSNYSLDNVFILLSSSSGSYIYISNPIVNDVYTDSTKSLYVFAPPIKEQLQVNIPIKLNYSPNINVLAPQIPTSKTNLPILRFKLMYEYQPDVTQPSTRFYLCANYTINPNAPVKNDNPIFTKENYLGIITEDILNSNSSLSDLAKFTITSDGYIFNIGTNLYVNNVLKNGVITLTSQKADNKFTTNKYGQIVSLKDNTIIGFNTTESDILTNGYCATLITWDSSKYSKITSYSYDILYDNCDLTNVYINLNYSKNDIFNFLNPNALYDQVPNTVLSYSFIDKSNPLREKQRWFRKNLTNGLGKPYITLATNNNTIVTGGFDGLMYSTNVLSWYKCTVDFTNFVNTGDPNIFSITSLIVLNNRFLAFNSTNYQNIPGQYLMYYSTNGKKFIPKLLTKSGNNTSEPTVIYSSANNIVIFYNKDVNGNYDNTGYLYSGDGLNWFESNQLSLPSSIVATNLNLYLNMITSQNLIGSTLNNIVLDPQLKKNNIDLNNFSYNSTSQSITFDEINIKLSSQNATISKIRIINQINNLPTSLTYTVYTQTGTVIPYTIQTTTITNVTPSYAYVDLVLNSPTILNQIYAVKADATSSTIVLDNTNILLLDSSNNVIDVSPMFISGYQQYFWQIENNNMLSYDNSLNITDPSIKSFIQNIINGQTSVTSLFPITAYFKSTTSISGSTFLTKFNNINSSLKYIDFNNSGSIRFSDNTTWSNPLVSSNSVLDFTTGTIRVNWGTTTSDFNSTNSVMSSNKRWGLVYNGNSSLPEFYIIYLPIFRPAFDSMDSSISTKYALSCYRAYCYLNKNNRLFFNYSSVDKYSSYAPMGSIITSDNLFPIIPTNTSYSVFLIVRPQGNGIILNECSRDMICSLVEYKDKRFSFGFRTSTENFYVTTSSTYDLNNWYYIVYTYDYTTSSIIVYINGTIVNTLKYGLIDLSNIQTISSKKLYYNYTYYGVATSSNRSTTFNFTTTDNNAIKADIKFILFYNKVVTQQEVENNYLFLLNMNEFNYYSKYKSINLILNMLNKNETYSKASDYNYTTSGYKDLEYINPNNVCNSDPGTLYYVTSNYSQFCRYTDNFVNNNNCSKCPDGTFVNNNNNQCCNALTQTIDVNGNCVDIPYQAPYKIYSPNPVNNILFNNTFYQTDMYDSSEISDDGNLCAIVCYNYQGYPALLTYVRSNNQWFFRTSTAIPIDKSRATYFSNANIIITPDKGLIVVSMPYLYNYEGTVFIFRNNIDKTLYNLEQQIFISTTDPLYSSGVATYFGTSITMPSNGLYLYVGCPRYLNRLGCVLQYEYSTINKTWFLGKIIIPEFEALRKQLSFGANVKVSYDNSVLAVSASEFNNELKDTSMSSYTFGAVFMFYNNSTQSPNWRQRYRIDRPLFLYYQTNVTLYTYFGIGLVMNNSGTELLVSCTSSANYMFYYKLTQAGPILVNPTGDPKKVAIDAVSIVNNFSRGKFSNDNNYILILKAASVLLFTKTSEQFSWSPSLTLASSRNIGISSNDGGIIMLASANNISTIYTNSKIGKVNFYNITTALTTSIVLDNTLYTYQGSSVSISNNNIVVYNESSTLDQSLKPILGRVHIVNSTTRTLIKTLMIGSYDSNGNPSVNTNSGFGYSVCIAKDGSFVLMSNPFEIGGTIYKAIKLGDSYDWNRPTPFISAKSTNSGDTISERLGSCLAIDNDKTFYIAGAPGYKNNKGAVYIYNIYDVLQATLEPTDITSGNFGYSVAISGNGVFVVVGCPNDNSAGLNVGSVYIYVRSGTTWTLQKKLIGLGYTGASNIQQGFAVSINNTGDMLAVGAPGDNNNIGAVWIYKRVGTFWVQNAKLVSTNVVGTNIRQGFSLSINDLGNLLIVGAPGDSNNLGTILLYRLSGSSWIETKKFIGNGGNGSQLQGYSIATTSNGNQLVVGGPGNSNNVGAIWTFNIVDCPQNNLCSQISYCTQDYYEAIDLKSCLPIVVTPLSLRTSERDLLLLNSNISSTSYSYMLENIFRDTNTKMFRIKYTVPSNVSKFAEVVMNPSFVSDDLLSKLIVDFINTYLASTGTNNDSTITESMITKIDRFSGYFLVTSVYACVNYFTTMAQFSTVSPAYCKIDNLGNYFHQYDNNYVGYRTYISSPQSNLFNSIEGNLGNCSTFRPKVLCNIANGTVYPSELVPPFVSELVGYFPASSFDLSSGRWWDLSGKGNDIGIQTAFMTTANEVLYEIYDRNNIEKAVISKDTTTRLLKDLLVVRNKIGTSPYVKFPKAVADLNRNDYTIFYIGRYRPGTTRRGRIFDGFNFTDTTNWCTGFMDGTNKSYHGNNLSGDIKFVDNTNTTTNPWDSTNIATFALNNQFFIGVDKLRYSGINKLNNTALSATTLSSPSNDTQFTIGGGTYTRYIIPNNQYSDWEVALVMFYSRNLFIPEINHVVNYISYVFGVWSENTTMSPSPLSVVPILDYSLPIIDINMTSQISGANWLDQTTNLLNMINTNTPAVISNFMGYTNSRVLTYNGTTQFSTINYTSSLRSFSVSVWFRATSVPTDTTTIRCLISNIQGQSSTINHIYSNTVNFAIYLYNGSIWGGFSLPATTGGVAWTTVSAPFSSTNWNNVVLTFDNTVSTNKPLKLYLNTVNVVSLVTNNVPSSSGLGIYVARRWEENSSQYFNGSIGGVKIWNRAISSDEVETNYYLYSTVFRTILALTPYSPITSGVWTDSTTLANRNATFYNSPSISANFNGYSGASTVTFNGVNQFASIPSIGYLPSFTISLWVNLFVKYSTTDGATRSIINQISNSAGSSVPQNFYIYQQYDRVTEGFNTTSTTTPQLYNTALFTADWNTNTWYNLVFTFDNLTAPNNLRFYLNSVIKLTQTQNLTPTSSNPGTIYLGYDNMGNTVRYSNYRVGYVKIWPYSLTQTEIEKEYSRFAPLFTQSYTTSSQIPTYFSLFQRLKREFSLATKFTAPLLYKNMNNYIVKK
jgi:hypothetical protein